jgi:hypothetical protein
MGDNVIVQRADGRCVGGQLGTGSVSAPTGDAAQILLLSMACEAFERCNMFLKILESVSGDLWGFRFKSASD